MISILMPVKNAAPYLKECIESIIGQSERNWELIAINDHSEDESLTILQDFEGADKRIRVFNNPGKGIIDALSYAYEKAIGDVYTRMDADDIMMPDKLLKMHSLLKKHPTCIVTSHVKYFSDNELGDGYLNYENWLNELMNNDAYEQQKYVECVLPSPNWMMEKSSIDQIGGFNNLEYPEDYDLCLKALAANIEIKSIAEVLHHWRDYPERTSRNHEHYRDNAFLALKLNHFLRDDYQKEHTIAIWGAGKKGKKAAKYLRDKDVEFKWFTNNQKKIGVQIEGTTLDDVDNIQKTDRLQLIILVAGPDDQKEIKSFLKGHSEIKSYWFC